MDFAPIVRDVQIMDARLFLDQPMGLRDQLVGMPFDARFRYDAVRNTLFINFERYEVRSAKMIDAIARKIDSICEPLGHRVHAVANYEGFVIDRKLEDAWAHSISGTAERWYDGVTRYTTSAFLRAKLGDALARRKLSPHVFETEEEACAALSSL
jgi:propionate CoA-transferase